MVLLWVTSLEISQLLNTSCAGNLPVNFQMQPLLLHYGPTPCGPGQDPQ